VVGVSLAETVTARVGIYCRISSDDRRDELGVKRQEHNCRRLAEAQGWHVADLYVDNDTSASKEVTKRPEFDRLVADVAARRVDVVLVQNQERLVRTPDELEQLMRALRKAGHGGFWTVTAGEVRIDSTNGRTMARVKGVFDIAYAEFISEKVKEKKDELAEKGLPSGGGTRAFGYEADRMAVRPTEAQLIREAAARILSGDSLHGIVRDWTDRGVSTVTGTHWTPNVLRGLLRSPRIAGLRVHRGEVVGKATWPAIITEADHAKLVAIFESRRGRATDATNRRLLTGLLVCARCGQPLWAGMNNGKATYACVRRAGRPGCFLSIEAAQLEGLVVDAVLRLFDGARIPLPSPSGGTMEDAAALEAERDELAAMFAAGDVSMGEWKVLRAAVQARLDRALAAFASDTVEASRAEVVRRYRKRGALRRAWPSLNASDRRLVLASVVDAVMISPALRGRNRFDSDRVTVRWRG
jgi:DNA invertase Pin-like site-specific DNA recombinase